MPDGLGATKLLISLVMAQINDFLVCRVFFPWRKYFYEDVEDNERKDKKREGYKQALHPPDSYFIDSEAPETLGEQLTSNDYIPACGKDAKLHKNC